MYHQIIIILLKILFIFKKGGRKRGRETSMWGGLSCTPYWEPGSQPRHVPWQESNQWPFGSQAGTQSTEPHQPGLIKLFFTKACKTLEIKRGVIYIYYKHEKIIELYDKMWIDNMKEFPRIQFIKTYLRKLGNQNIPIIVK